jgi:GntR family transcriptional regulator, rspAB operon transcriptional repressor
MKHMSLKEVAYSAIREKILTGAFQPGVRIREDQLAEEISMSRTPVREAINQLAAEGLVNNIPRKGIYLHEITPSQIAELLDVREALEVLAVVRCIDRMDADCLKRLEAIQTDFAAQLAAQQYPACNRLDSLFHREIAALSGNTTLIRFLSDIEDTMQIARLIEKKTDADMKNRITFLEHAQILACIANQDRAGAVQAVRNNLNRMKLNLAITNGKEDAR